MHIRNINQNTKTLKEAGLENLSDPKCTGPEHLDLKKLDQK